jgi:RHS repeat-associated protein
LGNAARKFDASRPEPADPAVVVDLAEYKHRRSRAACRLATGRSLLSYESASEPGFYRYTAFGETIEDTTTITQPLRWKGRWYSPVAGGIYDVRARQWSPEMGAFLGVDEYVYHNPRWTLWSWPNQNPTRFGDVSGHNLSSFVKCLLSDRSVRDCWADEVALQEQGCDPDIGEGICKAIAPYRGGPGPGGDEDVIRKACEEEGDIAYDDCLRQNFDSWVPSITCRHAKSNAERKCLEKSGLKMKVKDGPGTLPCVPLEIPIPVVP